MTNNGKLREERRIKARRMMAYMEGQLAALRARHGESFWPTFARADLCKQAGIEIENVEVPVNKSEWMDVRDIANADWAEQKKDLFIGAPGGGQRGGMKLGPRQRAGAVAARNHKIKQGIERANEAHAERAVEENRVDQFNAELGRGNVTPKIIGNAKIVKRTQRLLEGRKKSKP